MLCSAHPEHPDSPEIQAPFSHQPESEVRDFYLRVRGYELTDTDFGFAVAHPEFPDYFIMTWERDSGQMTSCLDFAL